MRPRPALADRPLTWRDGVKKTYPDLGEDDEHPIPVPNVTADILTKVRQPAAGVGGVNLIARGADAGRGLLHPAQGTASPCQWPSPLPR